MAGYTRVDTINNIADGNVINAADLDGEFDGIQAAFNSSTGHNHDGTAGEGAPILALGPVQDVTISTTVLGVKTTNTVDIGTTGLRFKDFYLAGNASVSGTLGVSGVATFSASPVISVTDNTNAALRITQLGTGNALLVEDETNPDSSPFVVDSIGRVSIGTTLTNATTPTYNNTNTNSFVIAGLAQGTSSSIIANWGNTTTPTNLVFSKSRSGTIGTHGVVTSATELGKLNFEGSDGSAFIQAASITAAVDGTPGTNDMPGRLVFSTTADGASTPTERMRIDSAGGVGIGSTSLIGRRLVLSGTITGATTAYGEYAAVTFQSDVTTHGYGVRSQNSTQATAFTLTSLSHFGASQGTIGAGSTVTNQYGFNADSSLIGATNNYGFYGNLASAANTYNLYMAGTATNYLGGNTIVEVTDNTNAALRITQLGTGNALLVEDSTNPDSTPFVIDASGRVGIGTTAPLTNLHLSADGFSGIISTRYTTGSAGNSLQFQKAYGTTASPAIVASGSIAGRLLFSSYDGSAFLEQAEIRSEVDGTPGTNDMPGRLVFSTTADGASTPTERMRIDSAGRVGIGSTSLAGYRLRVAGTFETTGTIGIGVSSDATIPSNVTTNAYGFYSSINTAASAFTLGVLHHFRAVGQTPGAGSTVTSQFGFHADNGLTGATNNYGFYGAIASGTGRYNFYAAGTAENFFGGNTVVSVTDNTNAALRITQLGTGNALLVEDSTNPDSSPFVIDKDGAVIAGYTATVATVNYNAFGITPLIQFQGNSASTSSAGLYNWSNASSSSSTLAFSKSISNVVGTRGALTATGTDLGNITFSGDDGTNFVAAVSIFAEVDGTPGTNDMPGRLLFSTTADGASTPTERMRINSSGNVGIGDGVTQSDSSFTVNKSFTGATAAYGIRSFGTIQSGVTNAAVNFDSGPSTAASAFTLGSLVHYQARQGTFGLGSAVTSQIGFLAANSLTGATNNYGFYGDIASGTGRWNLFMNGTADNYLAGNVGIGTTTPITKLEIAGTNNTTWSVTASITGTTMDVTAVTTSGVAVGDLVHGSGVQPYTRVTALGTGTGGIGTYTVSVSQTLASGTVVGCPTYGSTLIRITETDTAVTTGQPTGGLQFYTSDSSSPTAGVGAYVAALAESSTPDTSLVFGTRDNLGGGIDANERMRITSDGKLILNNNSALPTGINYNFQNAGKSTGDGIGLGMFLNATDGMNLRFAKSRSTTVGSFTAVQSGDELGILAFLGDDGTDLNNRGASLQVAVDGAVAANSIPSRFVFSTTPVAGTAVVERMRIDSSGNVLVTNVAGLGYGTGSGGTVTQATSKSTGVTLNKPTGQITMNNAALAANTTVRFLVTNSIASVTDCIMVTIRDGVTAGAYLAWVDGTANGSFTMAVRNITAGSLSDAVVLNFSVIKGATS